MVELAVAHSTTPFVTAYPWTGTFGVKLADPATPPGGTGNGVAFTLGSDALVVGHSGTPFATAYPWTGVFGIKFANPATLPASTGFGVTFTDADDFLAVSHSTTPFLSVYPWSGGGFGAIVADPATLPGGNGKGVDFTTADDFIAVAHTGTPFVTAYPWTGVFGAKVANPATLPPGNSNEVAFTTADDAIAVASDLTQFVTAYPWTGVFGAKVANPATLPPSFTNSVDFSAADDALAVTHDSTPFVTVYPWTGVFGVKVADPATPPAGNARGGVFNADDDSLAVAHTTAPRVTAYPWTGVFGVKVADPATEPTGNGNEVAFSTEPPVPPTLPASEPPFTLLDNSARIAQEDAFVIIDQVGRDQIRAVFISEIIPVAGVAISIVGGDCDHDPTQLPGLRLTWDQVMPGSGISFIAYDIMRRVAGEDDYTRIASITDITTLVYTDFCTTSRVTYEYSVRWRVTAGAAQVTSPDTDPPVFGQVEFDFLFLHLEKDSSFFARLDTYRADKRRLRDQRQLAVWGRERPTLAIGEQIWHQLRIPGLQQLLDDRAGLWEALLDLMDQEREQASVVCVRFGRASERYFCNFLQETQRQAQKSYTPDVTMVEVHFDEAV